MEIQDIIQGLTQAEITAITSPDERSLIVNTTLNQAVIYVNGTFKQASFVNTDDIPEGTNKFATSADLSAITANTAKVSFQKPLAMANNTHEKTLHGKRFLQVHLLKKLPVVLSELKVMVQESF